MDVKEINLSLSTWRYFWVLCVCVCVCVRVCVCVCVHSPLHTCGDIHMKTHQQSGDGSNSGDISESPQKSPLK